ncbi:MAG: hypothetical protein GY849_18455, partial [Deltaproteobacteria bacterium]|nr:hypothetical protein [Deltaproteobacteria bacterium]
DGVQITNPEGSEILPGNMNMISVQVTFGSGLLQGWVDFNSDGDWDDPEEQIFTDEPVDQDTTTLNFSAPADAISGNSFARFRLSTASGLSYDGFAPDGEVEDYMVSIMERDYGDAPDPTYPTLLASNGARHVASGLQLGMYRDMEGDGQETQSADGDDMNGGMDDEDGVQITNPEGSEILPGNMNMISVQVTFGSGLLQGWVDFNSDGDWDD